MKITAIIMASGMSKRMGEDKLLLKIKGRPIFEYVIRLVESVHFYERFVVARKDEILRFSKKVVGLKNWNYQKGQSESIRLGIKSSKPCDGWMFFVGDQPFLKKETIEMLIDQFDGKHIIQPIYNGIKGNPVIFPSFLKDDFMQLKDDEKGSVVIKKNSELVKRVSIESDTENIDIDDQETYRKVNI